MSAERGESASIFRTDQTDCFDAQGARTPCRGTGQDGELRCGKPWPEPRFVSDADTVTDRLMDLMWTHNANLFGYPLTWEEAFEAVEDMNGADRFGFDDWRLPQCGELFSLVSHRRVNPALPEPEAFENIFPGYYWTGTPCSRLPREAWYVHFGGGRVFRGMKHGSYMVWPVRSRAHGSDCGSGRAPFERHGTTITDRVSGLEWRVPTADAPAMTWPQAFEQAAALNRSPEGGRGGWRLPNIRELWRLVDLETHSPALPEAFRATAAADGGYWSSTTSAYEPRYAWTLYSQDGAVGVGLKTGSGFHALAVRSRLRGRLTKGGTLA